MTEIPLSLYTIAGILIAFLIALIVAPMWALAALGLGVLVVVGFIVMALRNTKGL